MYMLFNKDNSDPRETRYQVTMVCDGAGIQFIQLLAAERKLGRMLLNRYSQEYDSGPVIVASDRDDAEVWFPADEYPEQHKALDSIIDKYAEENRFSDFRVIDFFVDRRLFETLQKKKI